MPTALRRPGRIPVPTILFPRSLFTWVALTGEGLTNHWLRASSPRRPMREEGAAVSQSVNVGQSAGAHDRRSPLSCQRGGSGSGTWGPRVIQDRDCSVETTRHNTSKSGADREHRARCLTIGTSQHTHSTINRADDLI